MYWYVMRHGDALPASGVSAGDDQRALSPSGRAELERCLQGMKLLGIELDAVVTSPLARARESAVIIAEGLGVRLVESPTLRPAVPTEELLASLEPYREQRVLLVGHQPDLGLLVCRLVWGQAAGEISFRKGAMCCLNVTWGIGQSPAALEWFLTPDQLGRIGPKPK